MENLNIYSVEDEQQIKKPQEQLEEQQKETSVVLSEEEAKKMVDDFLNAPETPKALSNLQQIEEKYKVGSLPESVKNLYKKAKERAIDELKDDNNFKEALKQVGANIEGLSLIEIGKKDAKNLADGIVGDPETKQQVEDVKGVFIENNYAILSPDQKKALDDGVIVFQNSIKEAKEEIGLA